MRREAGDAEKMAKSVGNVFLLGEAIRAFGPEAVVGFLVSGHYRQPLAFGDGALEEAAARNQRIREFFREGDGSAGESPHPSVLARREAFLDALADDFNTPRALAELFGLLADARRASRFPAPAGSSRSCSACSASSRSRPRRARSARMRPRQLLADRERARADRDFARADEIRDRLAELGWDVRDTAGGRPPRPPRVDSRWPTAS